MDFFIYLNKMELCNEYIKAKFNKNLESYFCVKKKDYRLFPLNTYRVHPYKENKICLPSYT